jgi:peptidoglycan hydrolase CwlO-like protein
MDIIKKEIPVIQEKILEQISILNSQSEQKNKEISSEDNIIKKLKLDLEKLRRNAFFKKARTEILVAPPTKNSVETNIELINTKNVFSKASKMHQEKKKKSEECWRSEKNLKDEMIKLKNNRLKENKIDKKDQVSYLREIGYNPLAEKYDKEEEEESEESEQSSSDDNSDGGGGDKKKKEKELKNLQEQFSKLQKKFNDYEKKINEYKITYKDYKSKIEKLNNEG